ncbi:PepSY domain-containing protein [Amycolatopsis regifaucium]|uniref:PepSY domain-containing protein n=1 Tax=Amycolatopsis regifaucium TaxID=546365 RepID=UPI0008F62DF7|nr:PepSY domain-containing protein [Amycolatopsis regifaucium]SFH94848.1 Peptidase propeptide and YPEB domain-containing protein [Amycolatopsis regifaucium]
MKSARLMVGALVLVSAACSTEEPNTPPPNSLSPTATEQGKGKPVNAIRTAAGAVPDGRVFDVEPSNEGWEIKVASHGQEHKVRVSRDGGQVLGKQQTAKPSDDLPKIEQAGVDAVKALQAAQQRQPGELDEMEIDYAADGALIWEIGLRDGKGVEHEVNVDAKTGEAR